MDAATPPATLAVVMTGWIFAALAIFVVQTLLAPTLRYVAGGTGAIARLRIALGPRDTQPPMPPLGARAERALANMHEALPVFLAVALLHALHDPVQSRAQLGAAIFVVARALYVPAYLSGVLGLRSLVWSVSWIGLAIMIATIELTR